MPKTKQKKTKKVKFPLEKGPLNELWVYDEYNQGAIVRSSVVLEDLFETAEEYVTQSNVDNALTMDEKETNWEAFFPVFLKNGKTDYTRLYAGNKRNGSHYMYKIVDGKWSMIPLVETVDLRFFLGNTISHGETKKWYLTSNEGRPIKDIDHPALTNKLILFIKLKSV